MVEVIHDPEAQVFVARDSGQAAGSLHYRESGPDQWQMYHTEVSPRFEGRGIGSALVKRAVTVARAEGRSIDPTCWFVAGWIDRHPDATERRPESDVAANRSYWDERAEAWIEPGRHQWDAEPNWGLFHTPDSQLRLLPPSLAGLRSIELGCGTGYVSGWLARRGASATGIDASAQQLATALRLADERGLGLDLVHGSAGDLPFADESFDLAVTEYGAVTWVDPARWVPEAARVLRPGAKLIVFAGTPWLLICTPESGATADERLHRPYFGSTRIDWRNVEIDPGGVEFTLTISGWFEIFAVNRLRVDRFLEIQAPTGAADWDHVSASWAREYPAEQAWSLTRV